MRALDAAEMAYKNGYDKGYDDGFNYALEQVKKMLESNPKKSDDDSE